MMTNSKNRPKRRFSGFDGEWEQEKFGKIATIINGRAYSQDELLSEGKYKVLRVGNFYTNESWYYSNLELDNKYYANNGDLLYTWSATFGPHIWSGDKVIYHYHIWKVELSERIDKKYILQLLEKDKSDILSNKNGSTMVHITKDGMENKLLMFPEEIEEQTKIGSFLKQLDQCITLHQHKLDKLKNLKKSYLAELFPAEGERVPKRRFPDFEGEWEEKKLGEVVEFKRGLTYTPSSISKAGIRVLRSSNIDEDQFVLKEDDVFVDESKISIPFVEKGDILITAANGSSRLVGKHAIIDSTEKMVHGGFMLLAKSDQYKFINALLSSNWYTHFIDRSVLGGNGAIGNLSKSDLENEVPLFPSDEEQKQIGEFFQKIDKSISFQQEKLDKLKDLKKAYLNELFV